MPSTRRQFVKGVALAIASLAMARCSATGGQGDSDQESTSRGRLRNCWLQLEELAQQTQEDSEKGDEMRKHLITAHRTALDELVAAGEVGATVADQIQAALVEAVNHVWAANAPITCYEPMMFNYTPYSADQLMQQTNLLAEMADQEDLDPDTVARAQAAIERDVAFLALSNEEVQALYERLEEAGRESHGIPTFDDLDLEIRPEVAEAARYLVELLLEGS